MEASVDPQCRGPDWMPITPKTGSLFHAETQAASGIESYEILANRMGCFLRLRPRKRLVAGDPLRLVYIRLDQARIDRERFASNQPGPNAHRHHALKYPA